MPFFSQHYHVIAFRNLCTSERKNHTNTNKAKEILEYSYDFKLIKINCVAKGRTYFENKKSAKKTTMNQTNKQPKRRTNTHTLKWNESAALYRTFASKWFRRKTTRKKSTTFHNSMWKTFQRRLLNSIWLKRARKRRSDAQTYIYWLQ